MSAAAAAAAAAAAPEYTAAARPGDEGRKVKLHPLAIVSISDHHTRVQMGGAVAPKDSKIVGALFGRQNGLEVHIYDCLELIYAPETGLDSAFLEKTKELYLANFPEYDLLGWYTVGGAITAEDLTIQKHVQAFNELPLFLRMDPKPDAESKQLPVSVYESETHVINQGPQMVFVLSPFEVSTDQTERIGIEHVGKTRDTAGQSAVDVCVDPVVSALRTLRARVDVLARYLALVKTGEVEADHRLLRQIKAVCSQLPTPGDEVDDAMLRELTDTIVVTYLSSVTRTTAMVSGLTDKFTTAYGHRSSRRGGSMAMLM